MSSKVPAYRTVSANDSTVKREWYIVDAAGQVVGRMCSKIATVLRGKHKASYTPHVDCGDYVIVINAGKARFTGKKMDEKEYRDYSGYPGGQNIISPRHLAAKHPTAIIERGVKGMLPKTRLGRAMYRKLFVYAGETHEQTAQKPKTLKIN